MANNLIHELGTVQTIKDETDLLVIAAAERRRIPLFAICFGMQVLNVSRGGTLIQDISRKCLMRSNMSRDAPRSSFSSRQAAREHETVEHCRHG